MKTVILAGGTGTRLWPMSRQKKPKQFQPLVGDESMLVQTIKRLSFQRPSDIYIATNSEYIDLVGEQTAGLVPRKNLIVEPALRDTAPCIGLIAATLAKENPDEVMAVIYADHLIRDTKELKDKLKVAEELARKENTLNIIEVKAVTPNINLGYVKIGGQLKTVRGIPVHQLTSFVEKPDLATAKQFLRSQSYLWNTGLFVWKISTILEKFRQFQPETWKILQKISAEKTPQKHRQKLIDLYPLCPKISIDYAIMEKVDTREVRIIPADLGWSDIGTWESIWQEIQEERPNGLVTHGNIIDLDSHNCLLYGDGKKPIAAIGLNDLIVVDTPDALLVCRKDQSHQIKKIVEKLKMNFDELL